MNMNLVRKVLYNLFINDVALALFQTAIIGDDKAEMFRSKVTSRINMLNILQIGLIIAGSVMFLAFMISYFVCRSKKLK